MSQPSSNPTITLDDLIALNDEIAALVRAKVPLERGLQDLGRDLPGRLGQFALALARRTGSGEPLVEVLGDPDFRLPKLYRAVVEAGVRAGRLPAALESLAGSMRRLAESRRGVVLAFLYPLLLLIVAWGFFAFTTAQIAPKLLKSFEEFACPAPWCSSRLPGAAGRRGLGADRARDAPHAGRPLVVWRHAGHRRRFPPRRLAVRLAAVARSNAPVVAHGHFRGNPGTPGRKWRAAGRGGPAGRRGRGRSGIVPGRKRPGGGDPKGRRRRGGLSQFSRSENGTSPTSEGPPTSSSA